MGGFEVDYRLWEGVATGCKLRGLFWGFEGGITLLKMIFRK